MRKLFALIAVLACVSASAQSGWLNYAPGKYYALWATKWLQADNALYWKGDTIRKELLIYADYKTDSIRFKRIGEVSYSPWYYAGQGTGGGGYILPTASATVKGGIKIGTGLSIDPVTSVASVNIASSNLSDASSVAKWSGLTSGYLPYYNGTNLVNSSVYTNGTNLGINTTVTTFPLSVNGSSNTGVNVTTNSGFASFALKGGADTGAGWSILSAYPTSGDFTIRRVNGFNALIFNGSTGYATFNNAIQSTTATFTAVGTTTGTTLLGRDATGLLTTNVSGIGVSALNNDAGYLTSYTETDPTIYAWAKASTKPSYVWTEIGSKPTFATVATSGSYNDLTNKPTLFDGTWSSLSGKPFSWTSLANNQLMKYNSTSGLWENWTPNYLTGNQTITLSGVVTGSGSTSITTAIADGALSIAKTTGLQTALDGKQASLSGTGLVKSTSGTISYITDNSTNWNTAYTRSGSVNFYGSGTWAFPMMSDYNVNTGFYTIAKETSPISGSNLPITSDGVYTALQSKQDALNGTGFVKASGATITYDNSTYLTAVPNSSVTSAKINVYGTPSNGSMLTYSTTYDLAWVTPVSGTGTSGRVTYWNGSTSLTSDADFTFDGLNLRVGATNGTGNISSGNFTLTSDRRLKRNIKPISNLNKFDQIRFVQFNFKADSTNQTRYGVIAQEVEKVAPELVRTDKDGMKSVAYIDLLIAKIAELENRIKILENEK